MAENFNVVEWIFLWKIIPSKQFSTDSRRFSFDCDKKVHSRATRILWKRISAIFSTDFEFWPYVKLSLIDFILDKNFNDGEQNKFSNDFRPSSADFD